MKKTVALLCMICVFFTSMPFSACANEVTTDVPNPEGYAVIRDEYGNVIEELDVSVELKEVSKSRSGVTTYEITYTAAETKTDPDDEIVDGVTAVGSITWNDFFGTSNQLVSVGGHWSLGSRTISNLFAEYGVTDALRNPIGNPYYPLEMGNPFYSPENNVTGLAFYLHTSAKINETENTIDLWVYTRITT